ncbi:MAG: glycosyltransferase family 4 protein [Rikenellaceae bacterium]|jgi:glycosyltransferase involved in cell wall biosynthesis|nr:glycosyltransferase family 4 protein [Rikenellaceae bacterium]
MQIGFDAKRAFFNRSGLGVYSRSTVALLAKYAPDNHYTLFSPKAGNPAGFAVPEGVDVVYPRGLASAVPSLWRTYAMAGSIRSSGVGVYHGLSHELPADIHRARVRSVVTMHDIIFVHHPELYTPADRRLYTIKYKQSCHAADRIIAISEQTRADLVNEWNIDPAKIEVIYQGCDPQFGVEASVQQRAEVRARYRLPDRYILSVGSIEERKNLMLTVRAMVEGRLDVHLVAIGRHTPYSDRIMEYATAHGIADRISMHHNARFDDLPALYQMADGFVYTSLFEGFGIPIIEALTSRVPVITSAGGVFPEAGGDACIYVNPFSVEQMIEALRSVLSNSTLRADMIARGTAHAARFAEPLIAQNLTRLYRSLL